MAASEWLRATAFEGADWVPGPYAVLATNGFGRSDTQDALRRYYRIDAESVADAAVAELVKVDQLEEKVLTEIIERYELDGDRTPFWGISATNDVTC